MPRLYIYDHLARKHTALGCTVVSTDEIVTDHDGHVAGEIIQRKRTTYTGEFIPEPGAKPKPFTGVLKKDDLANWQAKTYIDLDSQAQEPRTSVSGPAPQGNEPPKEPESPKEPEGPPKPKK